MADAVDNPEPMSEERSPGPEKIDLSLDEIIKINRKEARTANSGNSRKDKRAANRQNVLKKLDRGGFHFGQGAYPYQGFYRSRYLGPPVRRYYKVWPFGFRRGAGRGRGVSPLNRTALNEKAAGQYGMTKVSLRGAAYRPYYRGGRPRGVGRTSFSSRGQKTPQFQSRTNIRGRRPFILNRDFRGFTGSRQLESYHKVRSWRQAPTAGTVLTVSLTNAAASPDAGQTATAGSFSDAPGPSSSQPRGIPLRFNFKATSNQTGMTLNDRFTRLRIRGQGQRSWRGHVRGRGRGRGRGAGRSVTLQ
ncbi:UAP56-interacting factor [Denticeps clupeoides]|uniref:UAP56-interacting factor-like n=1 Tax=Denticeps clupeoides TaxID=299321 RepID=UPI0010A2F0B8|nr:UAP56-interacting factor-like [Denticeps clupeoides]XP_028840437.1 UAP56-interacting factor-like [Denticeps clupeoides]